MAPPFCLLRLDVEAMAYHVVHAFSAHQDEVGVSVAAAVKKTIENFDFGSAVQQVALQELSKAIQHSVASAINSLFERAEVQAAISKAILSALADLGVAPQPPAPSDAA